MSLHRIQLHCAVETIVKVSNKQPVNSNILCYQIEKYCTSLQSSMTKLKESNGLHAGSHKVNKVT